MVDPCTLSNRYRYMGNAPNGSGVMYLTTEASNMRDWVFECPEECKTKDKEWDSEENDL